MHPKITVTIRKNTNDSLVNAFKKLDIIRKKYPEFNNIDNFSRMVDKFLEVGLNRIGAFQYE